MISSRNSPERGPSSFVERGYNRAVHDADISSLADSIYRERVERARRQPLIDRLLAGGELFDYACGITKAGIRAQNPTFTDEQVLAELRRRLVLGRRLEALAGKTRT